MRDVFPSIAERIHKTHEAYQSCVLCPHLCEVNRIAEETGFCRLGAQSHIYREYLHFGEEAELCPAYTVYLTGCSMRCLFCSEWNQITQPIKHGIPLVPTELALRIDEAIKKGAQSLNFVGGDPGVNLLPILKTLQATKEKTRLVWNSNLFSSPLAIKLLMGLVDLWLVDVKFGNEKCGKSLSGVPKTAEHVMTQLRVLQENNEEVWVRHLVMPGHYECCTAPVLKTMAKDFPNIPVNVMTHFLPLGAPKAPFQGRLTPADLAQVSALMERLSPPQWMLNGAPYDSTS